MKIREEDMRLIVRRAWEARGNQTKSQFVRSMSGVTLSRSGLYKLLSRIEKGDKLKRKPGSGRKCPKFSSNSEKRLCEVADGSVGISFRSLGKKFGISDKTVKKKLQNNGICMYQRRRIPKVTEKQKQVQKKRIRGLSRSLFKAQNDEIEVVMDDESYFDENGMSFYGSKTFLSSQPDLEPEIVRFNSQKKFPFKLMVWVAISKRGRSAFFIKKTYGAVNTDIYKHECIKKRLFPFLKKHYSDGNYIFWPDLASCHYSGETEELMRELKINFVDKELNPPNVPNLRPIENFWSAIKQQVYGNGYKPESIEDLEKKVRFVMRKVTPSYCERFMSDVPKCVRLADRKGPFFNI